MNIKSKVKWFFLFVCFLMKLQAGAQCTGCTTLVVDNTTANYTVAAGQKLCIASNFTYTGNIYLEGGTVCNDGTINKIHFYSGILNNNITGKLSVSSSTNISFNLNGQLIINNYSGSQIISSDDVTIDTDENDSLIINIHEGSSFNCNNFNLNSGKARFNVGLAASTTTSSGFITSINVNGNATLKSHFNLLVNESASFNINGFLSLKDVGLKAINNYGVVNITGTVGINGDGSSTSTVTINNYGEFSSYGTFDVSIVNAYVMINNYGEAPDAYMYIDGALSLEQNSIQFANENVLQVDGDINLSSGTFTNDFYIEAQNLYITSGVYTNNSKTILSGDLTLESSGTPGTLSNNGIITIANNFENNATLNMLKKSVCVTTNYNNTSTGLINGSADILNDGHDDNTYYPEMVISGSSVNSGTLTGYLKIIELSYSGPPGGVRFDDVGGTSTIGGQIEFPTDCDFDLAVGYIFAGKQFSKRPQTTFCPGENITLTYNPYVTILSGPTWSSTVPSSGLSYSSGYDYYITGVQGNGIVTVWGTYYNGVQECGFSIDFAVNVGNGSVTATSPVYFGVGNTITLNPTVTVGSAPFQFTWTPNYFFAPPSTQNDGTPTISPQVSLIYTVNMVDSYGCTASTTVEVIGEPFALLHKKLNGEYYKLFNNQLFFKYDGQYDVSGLMYYVYDKSNAVVASASANNLVNVSSANPGDNRLTLNAATLSTGYYVLEVINEKTEKLYLRFKK
jgi:hypothetical protein